MSHTKYTKIFKSEPDPIWPSPFEIENQLESDEPIEKNQSKFLKVYLEVLVILFLMIGMFAPLTIQEEENQTVVLVSRLPKYLPIKPIKKTVSRLKKGFPLYKNQPIIPMTRSQKILLPFHEQVRQSRSESNANYASALFKRAEAYRSVGQYQQGIKDLKHGYRLLIQDLYIRLKKAEETPNLSTMSTLLEQIESLQSEANAMLNIYMTNQR